MLRTVLGHVRHNVVAYLALFFALGGSALATGALMRQGDPAGGDLTGTYPNPVIAANAVTGAKVLDNSLTGDDILESSLGEVPSAAMASTASVALDAKMLNGKSSTYFLPSNATAVNSDRLGGWDPTVFAKVDDTAYGDVSAGASLLSGSPNVIWIKRLAGFPEGMYCIRIEHNAAMTFPKVAVATVDRDPIAREPSGVATVALPRVGSGCAADDGTTGSLLISTTDTAGNLADRSFAFVAPL